jgi:hypothetical protein
MGKNKKINLVWADPTHLSWCAARDSDRTGQCIGGPLRTPDALSQPRNISLTHSFIFAAMSCLSYEICSKK